MKESFITWVQMNTFLISNFCKIVIIDALEDHAEITKGVIIIWFYFQCLQIKECSVFMTALFMMNISKIIMSSSISGINFIDHFFE